MCYARALGDCSAKRSAEHYISRAVLKEVSGDKPPIVQGLRRLLDGPWPLTALTSNILCSHHNSALSPLDTEGAKVVRYLRNFQTGLDSNVRFPSSEKETADGSLFERWLLKVAFGLAKATQIGSGQTTIVQIRDEEKLLEILFDRRDWPENWGLYLDIVSGQPFNAPVTTDGTTAEFGGEPLSVDGILWAMRFWIRSIPFILAFGKPDNLEPAAYRPAGVQLGRSGSPYKVLEFSWTDRGDHVLLDLFRIG